MSSRNGYLDAADRKAAPVLHKVLCQIAAQAANGQSVAAHLEADEWIRIRYFFSVLAGPAATALVANGMTRRAREMLTRAARGPAWDATQRPKDR